jgi:hypothetical protein
VFTVRALSEVDELGLNEHVGACADTGCTEQVNETELLKPPVGATLTVPVADSPALTVPGDNGDADKEKSGTAPEPPWLISTLMSLFSEFATAASRDPLRLKSPADRDQGRVERLKSCGV